MEKKEAFYLQLLRRAVSLVLVLSFLVFPGADVFAESEITADGSCGKENAAVAWQLDSSGTLTISGSGEMADYEAGSAPWAPEHAADIRSVVIQEGVTSVGSAAFSGCTNLTEAALPDSIQAIGAEAFDQTGITILKIPKNVAAIGDKAVSSGVALSIDHNDYAVSYATEHSLSYSIAHSFTDYVSNNDATCTKDGTKTAACDAGCGATDTVADPGSAHHRYSTQVIAPTYTEQGYTLYTCTVCEDSYKDDYTDPLGYPDGWNEIDGKWYYYKSKTARTGWLQDGEKWYYLDPDTGAMLTGWQQIDGRWYYLNNSMLTGWQQINGKWYYLSSAMQTGWQQINGKWYYLSSAMQTGWQQVSGKWYYLNNDMQTGWKQIGGKWYYLGTNGAMATGWKQISGKWYYFGGNGAMTTGWQQVNGKWYYLGTDGAMTTGWQQVGGKWYYLGTNGAMATGWKQISGKWYYLGTNGAMTTGWQRVSGEWYYLGTNGAMTTGWQQISGKWYYLNHNMTTGWQQIGGKWYYFSTSGAMATGWQQVSGKWYYLNSKGAMQTGWQLVNGKWYYFGSSGAMAAGWQQVSGKWYYLNNSMQTGWQQVSGKWYYLSSNGVMKTGWLKSGSTWYYLKSSGVMATGWQQVSDAWYYFTDAGKMVTGWQKLGSYLYYFDTTSGRMTKKIDSSVDPDKPMVALTYDDGPYTPVTSRILDALEEVGGRCTFFNVGNRVSTYSSVVRRAISMGCSVNNHSWDHEYSLTDLSASGIASETNKCNNAIYSVTGVMPKLVRPVGGAVNSTVRSTIQAPLILWSIDTEDWSSRNATSVYNEVIGKVQDGDIVLMHDLYESTATASEWIIPELVREGYQLVTVEELAYYKGYTLENGKCYYCFR